jgi:hypothetical protein
MTRREIRTALYAAYLAGGADRILERNGATATVDRLLEQLSRPKGISEARREFNLLRGGNVVTLKWSSLN